MGQAESRGLSGHLPSPSPPCGPIRAHAQSSKGAARACYPHRPLDSGGWRGPQKSLRWWGGTCTRSLPLLGRVPSSQYAQTSSQPHPTALLSRVGDMKGGELLAPCRLSPFPTRHGRHEVNNRYDALTELLVWPRGRPGSQSNAAVCPGSQEGLVSHSAGCQKARMLCSGRRMTQAKHWLRTLMRFSDPRWEPATHCTR